jgi:hypothetical protein
MNTNNEPTPRAGVPADIGAPDRIAFGLTFRQIAILGAAGLGGWFVYTRFGHLLPPIAWLVLGIPLGAVVIVVALGRRDGLPLDVWLRHGFALTRAPKRFAPGQPGSTTAVSMAGKPAVPAPLRPTATAITEAGVITAEGVGHRLIACGTTNVHLRTGDEQAALLDGFGRFLNSLTRPAQILVAAQRHDLTPYAEAVLDASPRLPHPALQAAADDYATFLLELDQTRDPLRRQVLVIVAADHGDESASRALSGLGVTATTLDGPAVTAALATAVDPYQPPSPGPRATPQAGPTIRSTP